MYIQTSKIGSGQSKARREHVLTTRVLKEVSDGKSYRQARSCYPLRCRV